MKKYEKYKDSGVEWIGVIPEEWERRRLKFTVNGCFNGFWGNEPKKNNNDIIVIRVADFDRETLKIRTDKFTFRNLKKSEAQPRILKKGDLLLEKSGGGDKQLVGGVVIFDKSLKAITSNFVAKMTPKTGFSSEFLCYTYSCFYSKKINYKSIKQTTGIQNIDSNQYLNEEFYFPSLTEQTKIATFLDKKTKAIEDFIKNKQELIEFLEEEKKTIVTNAVTKGINPDVNYKNSGVEWIGDIPEHWEVRKTKYLFDLIVEPAKKNNNYELLSIYTDIGVKPRKDLAEKGNKASTTDGYWKVKKGDFIVNKLLAWMGAIGLSEYEGVTSPAYDILRKNIELDERFYNHIFRCGVLLTEIKRYSKGIMEMRLRLYFSEFGNIPLVYPPLKEQQQIITHIEQESKKIDDLKEKYQKEIDLIKEYKERLIYDVVTGKMNVQDYEIH